jgi:hypothetical protein
MAEAIAKSSIGKKVNSYHPNDPKHPKDPNCTAASISKHSNEQFSVRLSCAVGERTPFLPRCLPEVV